MKEYLLGTLPEADTEKFDELCFTDERFADELKTAEKDLVDAYVQGELSGRELETFNSYYLASPIRREKVKFSQAFHTFAEKKIAAANVETSTPAEPKPKKTLTGFLSSLNIFKSTRPLLQWGFAAAALVFMLLGGWLFFQNSRLRSQMNDTQARRDALAEREKELQQQIEKQQSTNSENEKELARLRQERQLLEDELKKEQERAAQQSSPNNVSIASLILLPQLRGSNQLKTVTVSNQTDYVSVQLVLESDDYKSYRVTLQGSNQTIWRSGNLKTRKRGESKTLNIRLPARLVKSQIYSLDVYGITADGNAENISSYTFKSVRK
jgi:hypothetical protein